MRDPIAHQKQTPAITRSSRAGVNPYVLADATFTREEILRARQDDASSAR